MTGTLVNVALVLAGSAIGVLAGGRLPDRLQRRVLAGLGLVTLVLGVDNALAWKDTSPLIVIGAVLLGGVAGEAIRLEDRLQALGARLQRATAGRVRGSVAEGFVTASLLFCIGPLTVLGSLQDGLTGDPELLVTKALLDFFASIALAAALGAGVAFSAISVLVIQGSLTLGAGLFEPVLGEGSEALAAVTSTGGVLLLGLSFKLLDLKDVRTGNFLPALVVAPCLVGIVQLV